MSILGVYNPLDIEVDHGDGVYIIRQMELDILISLVLELLAWVTVTQLY